MKTFTIIMVLVLALILVIPPVQVSAKAIKIEYSGYQCPTQPWSTPEKYWISGNVEHARGIDAPGRVYTGNEYLDGIALIVTNYDRNLLTGEVHGFGTVKQIPDAYAETGYFEGTWTTRITDSGFWRKAVLNGYGSLKGIIVTHEAYAMDENMCDYFYGTILIP